MKVSETENYLEMWTATVNLYAEGRLSDALTLADKMAARFPKRWSSIAHARACLLSALGRTDEALGVMRKTIEQGRWWSNLQLSDSDLDAIRENPQFSSFVEQMSRAKQATRESASPAHETRVFMPADESPLFLMVVLHMYGVSSDETAPYWRPATDFGAIVVVPESSQSDADGNPSWEDDNATNRDIVSALEKGLALSSTNNIPVVLAGASQGARHAMRLAVQGSIRSCRGFFALAGAADPDSLEPFIDRAVAGGLRGVMIAGGDDRLVAGHLKAVSDELTARSMSVHFEQVPHLGHWYPKDFPERLHHGLDFVLSH